MRKGREERMSYVESRQCARVLSPGLLSHHHKCEGVCLRLRPGPSGVQKYIQLVLPIGVQLEVWDQLIIPSTGKSPEPVLCRAFLDSGIPGNR